MKASKIRLKNLTTWIECMDALTSINTGWDNVKGGYEAWTSGYQTYLTETAKNKIAAIEKKMATFPDEEEDYG